jgi:VCBS repeat-containing protein
MSNATIDTKDSEALQVLLQTSQSEFNIPLGGIDMLIMDMPDVPPQSAFIVMVAQNTPPKQTGQESERAMGVCKAVDSSEYRNEHGETYYRTQVEVSPESDAATYLERYEHRYGYRGLDDSSLKITILKEPKHGTLFSQEKGKYEADIGYEGEDFASVLVESKGIKVKILYYFKIAPAEPPDFQSLMCGDRWRWKISSVPNAESVGMGLDSTITNLTDGAYFLSLPTGFAGTDYMTPAVTFANLPGTAVGETKGEGADATITLDTDAAGHGWFIDYTSYLNDEFLPTSNPNEWVAKAGSEASGKMDMLSVLLHEYGHALGLEHSGDAHDFMGTTLTPGMRRLPSSDELALMAQLVAEAKQNLAGSDGTAVADNGTTPTPSPIPTLPLGAGFGISFLGLTRRNNNSTGNLFGEALSANVPVQYAIAANPALINGKLESVDGWETTGAVAVNNGAAVFSEAAANQTRLNQVFVLGEHDRFLSFTIAAALGDQATGPDDAFEAALLDANTGLSLLGPTGLSRNDAFLNLQANGEEHKASGITRIDNADGSRTYLVDLGGIAAGTVVNLSFDLIAFGQGSEASNSRITVRDLRLGVPQTADDTATLAEDAPTVIDALANDLNAFQPGFVPVIVNAPSHGQVSINPDGSFSFTPEKDWYGEDLFIYKISDGRVDSNLATVTLTVTPVNDAPTAGDQQLTIDEDTPITGNLLAVAADIDSVLLQGSIVAGPQHGQVSVAADGSFTYLADANYNGADSFTYKVNDGELDSAIATVMLNIVPVNDAPVASAIAATLLEDGRITLNLLDSANDVDGDSLSVSVGTPQHGQLLKNADGSYTYVPQADYNGEDSFSYLVSDGQLDSGQALVRLTITAVNDAPVAQDDIANLDEDHSIHLSIMANDYDVDGDSLSLVIVDQPAHGTLVVNADNTVSYTPMENWSGEDSFSYKLNDGELDSGIATVRLIVTAVADVPTLVLSEVGGASRELFRTGWESVTNRNANSTLLNQRELEGWTFVARPDKNYGDHDDHDDHHEHHEHDSHEDHGSFEIWSTGDKMADAQHKRKIVSAANGNGSNWLELNNAKGEGHETLGIERSIETIAGASYTLSIDLAGHLGYGANTTRIGIYIDGVKIGSDESTSPATMLNWQTRSFQFVGKGGAQTIRILSEADQRESNGRGMMLDNIALTETLQANTGFEDSAVPLSAIGVALRDTDGSEILTLTIGAIPVGATLSDGTHSFTATLDHAVADVTGWNLGKLTIMPPKDFNGQFALKVVATSTEQANRSQASSEADLLVTVLPVNDAPLASNASYTLTEGGSIVIDFAGLISDVDGDMLSLSFTDPKKGTLTMNADGTYTYTPKREFSGTEIFTYTVSDGKLSTTASITLTVLPENDDDEDHHDNGLHYGFEHSEHNGYQGYDEERCAKIIVQSVLTDYGQQNDDRQDAMVNNQQSNRPADKIDWAGQAPILGKLKKDDWVIDMMTVQPKEQSLAEQTGLVVKMK